MFGLWLLIRFRSSSGSWRGDSPSWNFPGECPATSVVGRKLIPEDLMMAGLYAAIMAVYGDMADGDKPTDDTEDLLATKLAAAA